MNHRSVPWVRLEEPMASVGLEVNILGSSGGKRVTEGQKFLSQYEECLKAIEYHPRHSPHRGV